MSRLRDGRSSWWVLVAALFTLFAACTQQTGDGPPASPPRTAPEGASTSARPATPAAVTWVGQLCTTIGGLVRAIQDATPEAGLDNPDDLKRAWSNQLGVASASLTTTADQLGQLGP